MAVFWSIDCLALGVQGAKWGSETRWMRSVREWYPRQGGWCWSHCGTVENGIFRNGKTLPLNKKTEWHVICIPGLLPPLVLAAGQYTETSSKSFSNLEITSFWPESLLLFPSVFIWSVWNVWVTDSFALSGGGLQGNVLAGRLGCPFWWDFFLVQSLFSIEIVFMVSSEGMEK